MSDFNTAEEIQAMLDKQGVGDKKAEFPKTLMDDVSKLLDATPEERKELTAKAKEEMADHVIDTVLNQRRYRATASEDIAMVTAEIMPELGALMMLLNKTDQISDIQWQTMFNFGLQFARLNPELADLLATGCKENVNFKVITEDATMAADIVAKLWEKVGKPKSGEEI